MSQAASAAPVYGFQQLNMEIIRGVIETVADRPDDTEAQKFARTQAVVFWIMAFLPRDPVETMLAGQCVVFDHVLRDGVRDLLRGQSESIKLKARPQLNATGNMVLKTLTHLNRLQARPADGTVSAAGIVPAAPNGSARNAPPAPAAQPTPAPRPAAAAQALAPPPPAAPSPASAPSPAWAPETPAQSAASLMGGVSQTAMAAASGAPNRFGAVAPTAASIAAQTGKERRDAARTGGQ